MIETPSPTPSGRLSTRTQIALGAFCALVMLYSFVIAQQLLLGVLVCGVVWTAVVGYRLVGAFFRFVDATERIADALESREETGRSTGGNSRGENLTPRSDDRSRDHLEDRW